MLRAVHGAHIFFLAHNDSLARHVLPAYLGELRPLKAVEQVRAESAVKVRLQPRDDRREEDFRVFQSVGGVRWSPRAAGGRERHSLGGARLREDVLLELVQQLDDVRFSREADELHDDHTHPLR